MRMARIKFSDQGTVYHCISRIVGGQRLLGDVEKERFRLLMWQQAHFAGLSILSYCLMSNHVHLLVQVPDRTSVPDRVLLERAHQFYGPRSPYVERLNENLARRGQLSDDLRQLLEERMGDVSAFMKELKQRFSRWYNRRHDRFGTLWAERFKSLVVEPASNALGTVSRYIDLNPVRAGLVADPAEYRWSGYGEAVGGSRRAQQGLAEVVGGKDWPQTQQSYRLGLYVSAGVSGHSNKATLEPQAIREELARGGQLELAKVLRLRVRFFTDGVALGSHAFVDSVFSRFRNRFSPGRRTGARSLSRICLRELAVLRNLRVRAFG